MRISSTRLFPILMMLALALLTFWLERAVREEPTHPSLKRHDPDYIVSNFTVTVYNKEGAAESMLSAARMVHYPDNDTTELEAPRVVQAKPRQPRMTARAERGALSSDGSEIFLYDNVLLVREASAERPEARMTTSFLHVLRDRSLVRTDRDVLIQEAERSLSGRGMDYRNDSSQLVLHSNVRGRFAAQPAENGK
jgi:lipopolysaccharide export system protein LptC